MSFSFGVGLSSVAKASGSFLGICYGLSSDFNIGYIGLVVEKLKLTTKLDLAKLGFDWSEGKITLAGQAP